MQEQFGEFRPNPSAVTMPTTSYEEREQQMQAATELMDYVGHQTPAQLSNTMHQRLDRMATGSNDEERRLAQALIETSSQVGTHFISGFMTGKIILERLDADRYAPPVHLKSEDFITQHLEDQRAGGVTLTLADGQPAVIDPQGYLTMRTPVLPGYCAAIRTYGILQLKGEATSFYEGAVSALRLHDQAVSRQSAQEPLVL